MLWSQFSMLGRERVYGQSALLGGLDLGWGGILGSYRLDLVGSFGGSCWGSAADPVGIGDQAIESGVPSSWVDR